ncbi:hypothetical protein [Sphingobium nicotianae]|uniref:DUF8021 domain-containing protein n=1 Tax=Sphingobium nicotianae TaxID=2782607 RepID=A0A9X1IT24_9SPHN|nr:hypothetical protein [Sphingobium nicotianae]MBT2189226.1 hypothetical protein [Sphingobium nicotianae]
MRHKGHAILARVVALFAFAALASPAAAQQCDRACLTALLTQYVDALVAHDPSRLPLAPSVRFTEDSKDLKLGEGLWKTVTARGGFRQDYLDTTRQTAVAHVQLWEDKTQALYSVLLHVKDSKIAGIETLVQRVTTDGRFQPTELGAPIKGMNTPILAGRKMSRAEMIKVALGYPEGLRIGNFTDGGTKFAPETYRVENGVITAGAGCGRADCGMYAQHIMLHPSIIANVAAVDEENGVVVLWMNFGYTDSYGPGNALVTFEAFKIWGGQIHSILAFFKPLPLATSRNWTSSDEVPRKE